MSTRETVDKCVFTVISESSRLAESRSDSSTFPRLMNRESNISKRRGKKQNKNKGWSEEKKNRSQQKWSEWLSKRGREREAFPICCIHNPGDFRRLIYKQQTGRACWVNVISTGPKGYPNTYKSLKQHTELSTRTQEREKKLLCFSSFVFFLFVEVGKKFSS